MESIPWEKIKSPIHVSFYLLLFFKKTPLSGSLLAKVFLLALLNESKSAVCVTKGLKEGRWRGGRKDKRKAVIKEPRDKDPSPCFPKHYVIITWQVIYPLGFILHI